MADENKSPAGSDGSASGKPVAEQAVEPAWKKAGFESEEEAARTALEANTHKSEVERLRGSLKKSGDDYLRQGQEVGDLRKKVKELESRVAVFAENNPGHSDGDEVSALKSMTDEEIVEFDAFLADPKNVEIKKQLIAGGEKAQAQFVSAYRQNKPVDLSKPLFGAFRKNAPADATSANAIEELVKKALKGIDDKNSAVPTMMGSTPASSTRSPVKVNVTPQGGVGADFFRKNK